MPHNRIVSIEPFSIPLLFGFFGVLMRNYLGEDGTVTHNQITIAKLIIPELSSTLRGKTNKHLGITKMIQESRAKYYFPGLARKIRAWVTSCPDCIANKRLDTRQIRPKMLSKTAFTRGQTPKSTFIKRIPTHHNNDECFFTLPFLLSDTRYYC